MSLNSDLNVRLEDGAGAWKDFPANKPGFGSINSQNNQTEYNIPDSFVF